MTLTTARLPVRQQSGFTLIEVMLIISIIGLIFSIIVSNLQDARQTSRDATMKQMARTTATLFEYERNQVGSYINYDKGRVSNNGDGSDCASKVWVGEFATKLQELCEGIVAQAEYESNRVLHYGVRAEYDGGNYFAIHINLNNGNWYCVGSNGGTSESAVLDTDQRGCGGNP